MWVWHRKSACHSLSHADHNGFIPYIYSQWWHVCMYSWVCYVAMQNWVCGYHSGIKKTKQNDHMYFPFWSVPLQNSLVCILVSGSGFDMLLAGKTKKLVETNIFATDFISSCHWYSNVRLRPVTIQVKLLLVSIEHAQSTENAHVKAHCIEAQALWPYELMLSSLTQR